MRPLLYTTPVESCKIWTMKCTVNKRRVNKWWRQVGNINVRLRRVNYRVICEVKQRTEDPSSEKSHPNIPGKTLQNSNRHCVSTQVRTSQPIIETEFPRLKVYFSFTRQMTGSYHISKVFLILFPFPAWIIKSIHFNSQLWKVEISAPPPLIELNNLLSKLGLVLNTFYNAYLNWEIIQVLQDPIAIQMFYHNSEHKPSFTYLRSIFSLEAKSKQYSLINIIIVNFASPNKLNLTKKWKWIKILITRFIL